MTAHDIVVCYVYIGAFVESVSVYKLFTKGLLNGHNQVGRGFQQCLPHLEGLLHVEVLLQLLWYGSMVAEK